MNVIFFFSVRIPSLPRFVCMCREGVLVWDLGLKLSLPLTSAVSVRKGSHLKVNKCQPPPAIHQATMLKCFLGSLDSIHRHDVNNAGLYTWKKTVSSPFFKINNPSIMLFSTWEFPAPLEANPQFQQPNNQGWHNSPIFRGESKVPHPIRLSCGHR